jgi:hypothetical protein
MNKSTKKALGKISTIIAAAVMFSAISGVATAATTTGDVSGYTIAPLGISKTTDFNFGSIIAGASSGTVVLSTASGRSVTGGTALASGASVSAALFSVSGEVDATFSIDFSSGAILKNTAGTHSMTVDSYVAKVGSTANQSANYIGTLTTSPVSLTVGATLHVGTSGNNPAGTYSTSNSGGTPLTVTVAYN